jgi:hypothetical protein
MPGVVDVSARPRLVGPPDPGRVARFAALADPELAGHAREAAAGTIRLGASACAVCGMLADFAVLDTLPDGSPGPCPGPVAPVPGDAVLPGEAPMTGTERPCHPTGWERF